MTDTVELKGSVVVRSVVAESGLQRRQSLESVGKSLKIMTPQRQNSIDRHRGAPVRPGVHDAVVRTVSTPRAAALRDVGLRIGPDDLTREASQPKLVPMTRKQLAFRLSAFVALVVAISSLASQFLGVFASSLGEWVLSSFDWYGMFVIFSIADSIPMFPGVSVLFIGVASGMDVWFLWALSSVGSMLAASIGWSIGMFVLSRSPRLMNALERHKVRGLLRKHGIMFVAFTGVIPIWDFSITTYVSGAVGMDLWRVLVGSLFRIPRNLIVLLLIWLGWAV